MATEVKVKFRGMCDGAVHCRACWNIPTFSHLWNTSKLRRLASLPTVVQPFAQFSLTLKTLKYNFSATTRHTLSTPRGFHNCSRQQAVQHLTECADVFTPSRRKVWHSLASCSMLSLLHPQARTLSVLSAQKSLV